MSIAPAVGVALIFCWIGMVLAISFLEAPLKFRAPGVTLPIGLGIGRLVFRALNVVEVVFAAVILVTLVGDPPQTAVLVAVAVAVVALAAQLVAVRPRLTRRSDAVLAAGPDAQNLPRSNAHYAYVALEVVKLAGLLTGGILLLAG
ncbi:hypothetical protein [Mycolicibacterium goodii]|uniref:hypothetical protein n=1 Tax=Mycolicibacterium goodii TaxID=134601 RepID=UPI000C25822C|nr:hypothetical protein [Mycolicibacterium goodii]PJK20948.1 hypothetical protein CSX11_18525 [Mycolicibacterium goodii]